MNHLEVPYLPISEFDFSDVSEKFSDVKIEESRDDKLDLKDLSGKDFPQEVVLILLGMGMGKYIKLFKNMKITLDAFLNINESELTEVGIADEGDRRIIAQNLKFHKKSRDDLILSENHIQDLDIIKNVSYQLILLQNYCAYIELQMRKQKLTDYVIDSEDSACTFLKAFAECGLTQSQIMSCRIYDVNGCEGLIDKLLKVYNLTLPKPLQDSLPKKKRRKLFFKVMVFVGFSSVVVLTGTFIMRRS